MQENVGFAQSIGLLMKSHRLKAKENELEMKLEIYSVASASARPRARDDGQEMNFSRPDIEARRLQHIFRLFSSPEER